jgi:hypothetical protein
MQSLACPRPPVKMPAMRPLRGPLNGHGVLVLALFISFPVIGLEEFLRTTPAQFIGQPVPAIAHWVEDSLMALPLFAIGIAAADWIAERAGLCPGDRAGAIGRARLDAVKRAALITIASALVVAPAWFQVDRTDDPITAQPVVFPHASDSGDVYWVSSAVIVALACVTLFPLAAWAAHSITRGQAGRAWRRPAAIARAVAAAALIAAVPVAAWLLHQAAGRAYASRVYYSSVTQVRPRPHQVVPTAAAGGAGTPGGTGATPATGAPAGRSPAAGPAPGAFAYQAAHALEDGLVGQAAGLPVAIVALLLRGPGPRPGRRDPAETTAKAGASTGHGQLVHD